MQKGQIDLQRQKRGLGKREIRVASQCVVLMKSINSKIRCTAERYLPPMPPLPLRLGQTWALEERERVLGCTLIKADRIEISWREDLTREGRAAAGGCRD